MCIRDRDNAAAVLVVALICSFMPKNFILFVAAGFVTLHLYEVSLECAAAALVVFLLMFLLYFRFSPGSAVLVIVTPMLFAFKIPYAAPLVAGLLGNPFAAAVSYTHLDVYKRQGQYLSGALSIPVPEKRRKPAGWIKVKGAAENNLRNIDVKFPLGVDVYKRQGL